MTDRVGGEAREVDDRQLRSKAIELLVRGDEKQVADEQRVPSILAVYPHSDAMRVRSACKEVLNEQVLV